MVNPSGGLESKGELDSLNIYIKPVVSMKLTISRFFETASEVNEHVYDVTVIR